MIFGIMISASLTLVIMRWHLSLSLSLSAYFYNEVKYCMEISLVGTSNWDIEAKPPPKSIVWCMYIHSRITVEACYNGNSGSRQSYIY